MGPIKILDRWRGRERERERERERYTDRSMDNRYTYPSIFFSVVPKIWQLLKPSNPVPS